MAPYRIGVLGKTNKQTKKKQSKIRKNALYTYFDMSKQETTGVIYNINKGCTPFSFTISEPCHFVRWLADKSY